MYGSISSPAAAAEAPIIKGATIWSGVVNLSNTIVGAGMLGLPGAFGGTGWLSGIVLLVVAAAFSAHGLVLLSKAACISGRPSSFYSVAMASVPRYTILIDAAVALKCFGVATGYLITISDSMVNALDHILLTGYPEQDERFFVSLLLSRHVWVLGALVLVLPFSFYRTLDELKKASALALVFVFMLVGMIVSYANGVADPCAGREENVCRGEMEPYTSFGSTLSNLPIFVFAFTCHQNIFPIVNELDALCQRRLNIVICCSIGFALTVFAVVALEGYKTYGSLVRGDILLNYPENQQVTFLRICIAFMLALHYPLQLDPSRRCITSLVKVIAEWNRARRRPKHSGEISASSRERLGEIEMEQEEESVAKPGTKEIVGEGSSYYEMTRDDETQQTEENRLFYAITILFLSLSFLLAIAVDDLGVILALVGATGSTLVSYVLPGLIYIKIYSRDDTSKKMARLQLGAGITIMPLALYFILTQQIGFSHAFHVATPMRPSRMTMATP
ncbi:hypothetical protein ACHAXT_010397 [Thalassiosira profunda]